MQDTQAVNPAGQTPINAPVPDSTPTAAGTTDAALAVQDSGPTTGDAVGASTGQSTDTSPVTEGAQIPTTDTQTLRLNDGSEISIDEARDGYLRQADYTRKTQEVAEKLRQVEAWGNYYQQLNAQGQGPPSQVESQPQEEALSPIVFNEADYATEVERKLAIELNNTRQVVAEMGQRFAGYDERFAMTERQRADDHVNNELSQWTAQFNVTEAEILALHEETGVSNVKVLAEFIHQRKQIAGQLGTTQAQQVDTAAHNAQSVTQPPKAAPQSTETVIDYSAPMSQRLAQLRAKYPNI